MKAWRAIVACRTAALGGHLSQCDACGVMRHIYHSCRNRHCPQCQTRAKEEWIARRGRELLPVPYFHLVFTLPHALNGIAARHPRLLYELLFGAVSQTLTEFAADPRHLGGTPAFTLVLHTWTQQLTRHPHLHALMAGGALSPAGAWVSPKRGFLFPVKALSKVFRGKLAAALREAHASGPLAHDALLTAPLWRALLVALYRHQWVVYAKESMKGAAPESAGGSAGGSTGGPLSGSAGGPAQVLDYLARYTHRVAISNDRIVGLADGKVAFRVRDAAAASRRRTVELPATEFIGRFLSHVLPAGFKRIRHYGLLASRHKTQKLAACRALFNLPPPAPVVIESVAAFMARVAQIDVTRCPCCSTGRLIFRAALIPLRRPFTPRSSTGPPLA